MCASYQSRFSVTQLVEAFSDIRLPLRFEGGLPNLQPVDEVRPTDLAPVIRADPEPGAAWLERMRFGFPAPRSGGKRRGGPVINFRSEGRRFGNGARSGRGLVPVSGFYEFTGDRYPKTRWLLRGADAPVILLACLWRAPEQAGGEAAFSLLTAEPGPDVAPYHTRGVIPLPPDRWADWLLDRVPADQLLTPPPAGTLVAEPAPRGAAEG